MHRVKTNSAASFDVVIRKFFDDQALQWWIGGSSAAGSSADAITSLFGETLALSGTVCFNIRPSFASSRTDHTPLVQDGIALSSALSRHCLEWLFVSPTHFFWRSVMHKVRRSSITTSKLLSSWRCYRVTKMETIADPCLSVELYSYEASWWFNFECRQKKFGIVRTRLKLL
jgi:hypothetical protein